MNRQPNGKYDITCSIVAFNSSPEDLALAIRGFLDTSLHVQLIVIDNSPTDALRKAVEGEGAHYRLLPTNVGFGAGHNLAIREYLTSSKYHLVLNPDAHLSPGALEGMHSYMEANPGVGLLSPKVYFPSREIQYSCKLMPTPLDLLARWVFRGAVGKLMARRLSNYELRSLDFDRTLSVPLVSGCCMFFRCEVLQQAGLFDERFFMYMEDFDLSRRVKLISEVVYYPGAQVFHRAAYAWVRDRNLLKHRIWSTILYFNKWGWLFDSQRTRENARTLKQEGNHTEILARQSSFTSLTER